MAHDRELGLGSVACDGCGEPTPYDAGPADSDAPTYGEWLQTPLGTCYVRTHRRRECVAAARAKREGRRIEEPMSTAERMERAAAELNARVASCHERHACPTCGAEVGVRCRHVTTGLTLRHPHRERIDVPLR